MLHGLVSLLKHGGLNYKNAYSSVGGAHLVTRKVYN